MPSKILIVAIISTSLAGCSGLFARGVETPAPSAPTADLPLAVTAPLLASDGSDFGRVTLRTGPQGLLLRIEGEHWPAGWHGVHLHSVGSCEAPAFTSAGGHVNHAPDPRPHGLLNPQGGPDGGDLQNVFAHDDGTARAELYLPRAMMGDMAASVHASGLALVVHANVDDHVTQPIGGAGPRIACAVLVPGETH